MKKVCKFLTKLLAVIFLLVISPILFFIVSGIVRVFAAIASIADDEDIVETIAKSDLEFHEKMVEVYKSSLED